MQATYLIDPTRREAIQLRGERNVSFTSVSKRLGKRFQIATDDLTKFPTAKLVGSYDEQSPELQGLWRTRY